MSEAAGVQKTVPLDVKIQTGYCIPHALRDEQIAANSARILTRLQPYEGKRSDPIAVVCYGPSLNESWELIKPFKYVMSCSGSHAFLLERGITPTWHIEVDPRPHKVQLMGPPCQDTEYLICSDCHPNMLDALEGYRVTLWHAYSEEPEVHDLWKPGEWAVTGGSGVGLRAIPMARFLGFRELHVFGMDGCEGKTGKHAGPHPNQEAGHFPVELDGKTFQTTASFLTVARETFSILNSIPNLAVYFYGDGLVQQMAQHFHPQPVPDGHQYIIAVRKPTEDQITEFKGRYKGLVAA